ncbi:MAG: TonB-dependent receptor plug domain-containing protein [Paludibacter sp.]|nr:TonB-dependent receptor plug domain-containing protein [Paludibacter sp.]
MATFKSRKISGKYKSAIELWFLIITLLGSLQNIAAQNKHVLISDTLDPKSIVNKTIEIREIQVTGNLKEANLKAGSTGINVDVEQLKQLPKFAGESDPYKALQYMGGVSQAGEANSGLYVRGGNNDQNLILLNGTLIQNPTHVLGMFSVFNPDLIDQMRFIKSGMPAEYGGRLSSIVDITNINRIPEKIKVKGSIGLISSRLSTQIPVNSRFSVYASLRGSYISSIILPTLSLLGIDSALTQNSYEFWDANAGFIYNLAPRTKLTCHFYTGKDEMKIQEIKKYEINGNSTFWQNTAAGLQLNHIFNDDWSMNHQLNYSKFYIQSTFDWYNSLQDIRSQFDNINYKADFFHIAGNHQFKFGTEMSYNAAIPHFLHNDSILAVEVNNEHNTIHSAQLTVYFRDEWTKDKWQFNIGVRSNLYAHIGPYTNFQEAGDVSYKSNSIIKTYSGIEPRFYSRYLLNDHSSLKLSATRHIQYLNQIPVFSFGIPTDLQIPASLFVKPQGSWHLSGGYFRNFINNTWEFSTEIYYKTLENQLEFKNGIAETFSNNMIEKNLLVGKGWNYGTEWKLSKRMGKFTGWISYNLAWSYRQFDQINAGKPFFARNDRRHDVSVIGMYELNNRWSFSTVFVYASGSRLNLPLSWYYIDGNYVMEYGKYNAFEMPAYHRLDISANYKLKKKKGIDSEINFSIYNLYNRANPFQVYFSSKNLTMKMQYLLPVIPSVSWTFSL